MNRSFLYLVAKSGATHEIATTLHPEKKVSQGGHTEKTLKRDIYNGSAQAFQTAKKHLGRELTRPELLALHYSAVGRGRLDVALITVGLIGRTFLRSEISTMITMLRARGESKRIRDLWNFVSKDINFQPRILRTTRTASTALQCA